MMFCFGVCFFLPMRMVKFHEDLPAKVVKSQSLAVVRT